MSLRRQRGITLVEVLLAMAISAVVMAVAGNAYVIASRATQNLSRGRDIVARQQAFESTLTDLFDHIYVDADATDTSTYFLSGDALSSQGTGGTTSGSGTSGGTTGGSSASGGNGSGGGTGDNGTIVFTVLGRRLPSNLLNSTDDFETNNDNFGPLAGVTEVELSTTAVGDGANGKQGLFMRTQAPADTDPTQGGNETLLSDQVQTITFEFYDGTDWQTTWDTTTMGTRRLPSAIRVTYRLQGDTQDRIVTFAVPSSDVTPDNPVQQETAS